MFGGDLDFYNSYAQRGNLPIGRGRGDGAARAVPDASAGCGCCARWGGIMDMTMDGAPIIGKTPIDGLYLDGGWCYGGFKATPASGWCSPIRIATWRAASAERRLQPRPFRRAPVDEKGWGQPAASTNGTAVVGARISRAVRCKA